MTVSGSKGEIPSPIVLDPGRYTISIKSNVPNLLLDYFVLLPAAYYEASILTRQVETPCETGNNHLCRHYGYPDVTYLNPTYVPFIVDVNDEATRPGFYYKDYEHLAQVDTLDGVEGLPLLSADQQQLNYMIDVKKQGKYVLVVDYITGQNFTDVAIVQVNQRNEPDQDGVITVYPCLYTMVCRQPVIDREAREKVFFINDDEINPIEVKRAGDVDIAIKSVTAIPYEDWSTDFIRPSPICVFLDGECLPSTFRSAPEARRVDFEHEIDTSDGDVNATKLVMLDSDNQAVSIS